MNSNDNRTAYLEGMRRLLDKLEHDPTIPLPYDGAKQELTIYVENRGETDAAEAVRRLASLLSDTKETTRHDGRSTFDYKLTGNVDGLRVMVVAHSVEVMTQTVVGQREVTRMEDVVELTSPLGAVVKDGAES